MMPAEKGLARIRVMRLKNLGHNMIPAQSHCIPLALSCVIFFQGVLQFNMVNYTQIKQQ